MFDSNAAADRYAEFDEFELMNIAHLDPNYLPQAKELAARELKKRGIVADEARLGQARREIEFRKNAVTQKSYEAISKLEDFNQKVRQVVLVIGLWGFSLFAPMTMRWSTGPNGWLSLLLIAVWLMFVVDAVRKYRSTGRKRLVYLLVVPATLAAIGFIVRFAT